MSMGWGHWNCLPAPPLTPVLTLCFSLCCAQPIPWDLWEVSLLALRWSQSHSSSWGHVLTCARTAVLVHWLQLCLQLLLLFFGLLPLASPLVSLEKGPLGVSRYQGL